VTTKWVPGKEPFTHEPFTEEVELNGSVRYRGACSCGWRNHWQHRVSAEALAHALNHVVKFRNQRRPCGFCAVWTCDACGWKRHSANPDMSFEHHCAQCGSVDGTMTPTMHGPRRYWQHLPENN